MRQSSQERQIELPNASIIGAGSRSGMGRAFVARPRILCVDDDEIGNALRGEILEEEGYSVVLKGCPIKTLRSDITGFDLAILDFEMPLMNGRELLLKMRAMGARFPILLLSGSVPFLSFEERVLFSECIDKSRPIHDLLDVVFRFLNPALVPDFCSTSS